MTPLGNIRQIDLPTTTINSLTMKNRFCWWQFLRRQFSSVALTSERHKICRATTFASLTENDVAFFESTLGKDAVLTSTDDLEPFNVDWLKLYRGQTRLVLLPRTTESTSAILRYCFEKNLAVCPQGGNTGLVGGSVPVFDEIVLSTRRLNKILSFDDTSGALCAEAGCILEHLNDHVTQTGFMMPLDLGAKGSCQIGGNVATSAGGVRFLRYGSVHSYLLGLEAVLPDGAIINCMSTLPKDNTGLHLPHLFVGSEGQLGIITKVALYCPVAPVCTSVAFVACRTFENCLTLLRRAKTSLAGFLSGFEFMDAESLHCVEEHLKLRKPITDQYPFYVLIETASPNDSLGPEHLQEFLAQNIESGCVADATLAADISQARKLWELRELITESLRHDGYVYKQDISLPQRSFYEVVEMTRQLLGDLATRIVAYGHLADGNVHLNITSKAYSQEISSKLYPYLYEWVQSKDGSLSAEHGLGFSKRPYIRYAKTSECVRLMQTLKRTLDPKGILNPYKTIPSILDQ